MSWLEDERALADELCEEHDLSALRASVLEEEDAVVIEMPLEVRRRFPVRLLAVAACGALIASAVAFVASEVARTDDDEVDVTVTAMARELAPSIPIATPPEVPTPPDVVVPPAPPVVPAPPIEAAPPRATRAVAPKETGRLKIYARPWANVTLDGVRVGATPILKDVTAGKHNVVLLAHDGRRVERNIVVRAGKDLALKVEFDQAKKSSQTSAEKPTK